MLFVLVCKLFNYFQYTFGSVDCIFLSLFILSNLCTFIYLFIVCLYNLLSFCKWLLFETILFYYNYLLYIEGSVVLLPRDFTSRSKPRFIKVSSFIRPFNLF